MLDGGYRCDGDGKPTFFEADASCDDESRGDTTELDNSTAGVAAALDLMGEADKKFVFDFGGVVFRWEPEALLCELLPERASDSKCAAFWVAQIFQGYGCDRGVYGRSSVTPAQLVQRITARTGLRPVEVKRVVEGAPQALTPLPDTVALLQRLLTAGRRLHYLSNMPAPMAQHLQDTYAFLGLFSNGVFGGRVFDHAAQAEAEMRVAGWW